MVICLKQGADLHTAQLMPLPLTVSCFSKIKIGSTFLVLAHPGSLEKRAVNVCVCVSTSVRWLAVDDVSSAITLLLFGTLLGDRRSGSGTGAAWSLVLSALWWKW